MSITVKYNGNTLFDYADNGTKTLKTSGKYCDGDISIINTQDGGAEPTLVTKSITENGTYNASDDSADGYSSVSVNVAGGGGTPRGIIWTEVDDDGYPLTIDFTGCPTGSYTASGMTGIALPYLIGRYQSSYCFHLSKVKKMIIPTNVTLLSTYQFQGTALLTTFIGCDNVKYIMDNVFNGCKALTNIDTSSVEYFGDNAFRTTTSLTTLNFENAVTIKSSLCNGGKITGRVDFGNRLETLENWVFNSCRVTSVYFNSTPTTIQANALGGNSATLTDIYVPWPEGEVANAPWGATSATIHYNYTGG